MIKAISEIQNMIYEMSRKSQIIKDMIDMRDEFKESPSYHMHVIKEHIDHVVERSQGRIEERGIQRQDYYQRVLKRFKMNYCEDPRLLKDLSLDAYKYIDDLIFEGASYDDIMNYVQSLK